MKTPMGHDFSLPGAKIQPVPVARDVGGARQCAWWWAVSLRLLYLIFVRLCAWLVLPGRSSASKNAGLFQEQIKRRPVLGGLSNEYEQVA
jgi:hypothetical protein